MYIFELDPKIDMTLTLCPNPKIHPNIPDPKMFVDIFPYHNMSADPGTHPSFEEQTRAGPVAKGGIHVTVYAGGL